MNDDLISRQAFIAEMNERIDAAIKWGVNAIADGNDEIKIRAEQAVATFCEASLAAKKLPSEQHTCETCCYWGTRLILRDGSLGDCGNFEKNLSKDFYCAWWSPKEDKDE